MLRQLAVSGIQRGALVCFLGLMAGSVALASSPHPALKMSAPRLDAAKQKAGATPTDVPANHWAGAAVKLALQNGILDLYADKKFHGDAKVTRTEAAIALAKLARSLETGKWRGASSVPLSKQALNGPATLDWQSQPVSRYTFASILVRSGNYVANGVPRPAADAKDTAQSIVLPNKVPVTVPRSHPAYASLDYLTHNHMLWANSPLLHPGAKLITGVEASHAVSQMITGLNDRLTPLGHDADGGTIDVNSRKRP